MAQVNFAFDLGLVSKLNLTTMLTGNGGAPASEIGIPIGYSGNTTAAAISSATAPPVVVAPPYANAGILTTDPAYLGTVDSPSAGSHVLTVGAGGQYATVAAAVAAAHNGDVIAINAKGGITLTNDFVDITQKALTIEGVGGVVKMVATIAPPNQKGIMVIDAAEGGNITIKNISFSGVAISDASGGNGAGIRYDSGNLSVVNCNFTNNQEGILANPDPSGNITIDHSTFSNNGSGTGLTHDIYIGEVANFTLSNSIVSSAIVGHEIKSRANNTTILDNIIQDGPTGTGSYNIDLPNGGNATIQGNYIEKGPKAQNDRMISFGEEGLPYANSSLTITSNTFVNDLGSQAIALTNDTLTAATVSKNTFDAFTTATLADGAATLSGNVTGTGVAIANTTQGALTPGPGVFIFTDSLAHSLVFSGYGEAAQGGGGLLSVTSNWGHETVYGGTGGLKYTDTGPVGNESGDVIATAAGSTNVIAVLGGDAITSAGHDKISLGSGNSTVAVSGSATVTGGAGTEVYQVQPGGALALTVATGSSNTVNVLAGSSATVQGDTNYLAGQWSGGTLSYTITEGGIHINATFVGGGGSAIVFGGITNITLAGGPTGSNVTLGAGAVTVTSIGADIIQAGTGNDTIIVSGNATIHAGTGALSVFCRGETGVATVYGNGGTTLIDGASGGIKYVGDGLAATVVDNLSGTEIDGAAGTVTITGTGYDRTIVGGSGGVDVVNAAGGDVITTAAGSTNKISLLGGSAITSNGTDQIVCGTGNIALTANGVATITGSHGNCQYTLNGTDTLTSYGSDTITVGANAVAADTASGAVVWVTDNGGQIHLNEITSGDKVSVCLNGAGTITAWGGSNVATIVTTAGKSDIVALAGGNNVVHSAGTDTIVTGAGNNTITDSGHGNSIWIAAESSARTVTINNFSASHDSILLAGFSGKTAVTGEVLSSHGLAVSLADGSVIDLTGDTSLLSFGTAGSGAAVLTTAVGHLAAQAIGLMGVTSGELSAAFLSVS